VEGRAHAKGPWSAYVLRVRSRKEAGRTRGRVGSEISIIMCYLLSLSIALCPSTTRKIIIIVITRAVATIL
jgi:hypothetical protein